MVKNSVISRMMNNKDVGGHIWAILLLDWFLVRSGHRIGQCHSCAGIESLIYPTYHSTYEKFVFPFMRVSNGR